MIPGRPHLWHQKCTCWHFRVKWSPQLLSGANQNWQSRVSMNNTVHHMIRLTCSLASSLASSTCEQTICKWWRVGYSLETRLANILKHDCANQNQCSNSYTQWIMVTHAHFTYTIMYITWWVLFSSKLSTDFHRSRTCRIDRYYITWHMLLHHCGGDYR